MKTDAKYEIEIIQFCSNQLLSIPLRVKKKDYNENELLSVLDERATMFIQFKRKIPRGLFERVLCMFVRESGQFEGSRAPEVFRDHASFYFREDLINITHLIGDNSFRISLFNESPKWTAEVLDLVEKIVSQLRNDPIGALFQYTIQLEGKDRRGNIVRCEAQSLKRAIEKNLSSVELVKSRKKINKKAFSAFFYAKPANSEIGPKHSGKCQVDASEKFSFHCFLAHEWGTQATTFKTHGRVREIMEQLQEKDFKIWFDEKNLKQIVF